MKKIISILTLISVLSFIFAACGKEIDEPLDNNAEAVYENIAFDNLKTFTEVTGTTLNSIIEDKTYETTFCYVVFENADQKITDYKTYLLELGYKMTSDIDAEEIVFESDEKEISITSEYGESGTSINITIPCDEVTNNARKEKLYKEMLATFEEKDFEEVLDIIDRFESGEIQNYKDVYAYKLFSYAMKAYDFDVYGEAREYFIKYCDEDKTDKLGAKAYIEKCDDILDEYNGTYSGKSFDGSVPYLMFIKDGKVALTLNNTEILGDGYENSAYYRYELRVEKYNNYTSLAIVYYNFGDIEYKYDLIQLDSGEIIVHDFAWDVSKYYRTDTSVFAGEYKKSSSDTPSDK